MILIGPMRQNMDVPFRVEGEMSGALRVSVASGSRLTTHFHRLIVQSDVIAELQRLASKLIAEIQTTHCETIIIIIMYTHYYYFCRVL